MRASERLGLDRAERTLHVLDAERCSGHAVLSRTKRVPVPMHRTDKKHVNSQTWSFLGLARVRTKQCRRQWAASGAAGPSEETEPAQRRHGGGGGTLPAEGSRGEAGTFQKQWRAGGRGSRQGLGRAGLGRLWLESGFILTVGVMELTGAGGGWTQCALGERGRKAGGLSGWDEIGEGPRFLSAGTLDRQWGPQP